MPSVTRHYYKKKEEEEGKEKKERRRKRGRRRRRRQLLGLTSDLQPSVKPVSSALCRGVLLRCCPEEVQGEKTCFQGMGWQLHPKYYFSKSMNNLGCHW